LQVWRFRGDWDWNGVVNISDLTLLLQYLFDSPAPPPQPTMEVGDINCDGVINVSDLTVMIAFLFITFQAPNCGP
ncbi:MAG: hypothetical protein D6800_15170, partial [Candidatus Zixiibacteriota bacterium]